MTSMIVPVYMTESELATILENNAGIEFLTKTREVRVRRLLHANAHGYPIPPLALEYIKQHHEAYLAYEAREQLKVVTPRDLVCTSGASISLQQRIAKRPKFDLEDIYRTGQPEADATGRPARPATYLEFMSENDLKILEGSSTPEEYKTLFKLIEIMYEINGSPCYDAEGLALGSLVKAEYFLMPDTVQFKPCGIDNICRGPVFWKPDRKLVSQVYALAKAQALQLGITGDRQIKWAVLRTQAFSAGWYHAQKYSRRCSPPVNSDEIYAKDLGSIEKHLSDAWKLVCFLPFVHEFAFRTVGSTWSYNSTNTIKYEGKTKKFADSASVRPALSYLTGKDLYGPALQWIGVEMPMKVLQRKVAVDAIPAVFAHRTKVAPAGKALITTTHAVVKEMTTLDCWISIQDHMHKFNDATVSAMACKIQANPWKYHGMPKAYNLKPLSEEEQVEAAAAMVCAEYFAPITFAFTQSVMGHHQLPGFMALKKYADENAFLYERFKKYFASMRKNIPKNIGAKVAAEASGIPQEHDHAAVRRNSLPGTSASTKFLRPGL